MDRSLSTELTTSLAPFDLCFCFHPNIHTASPTAAGVHDARSSSSANAAAAAANAAAAGLRAGGAADYGDRAAPSAPASSSAASASGVRESLKKTMLTGCRSDGREGEVARNVGRTGRVLGPWYSYGAERSSS